MRLLLALDGSDVSKYAADFLTRLPWPSDTEVTVVTVVVDTAMGEIDAEVWMKIRETAHQAALQNYSASAPTLGARFAQVEHVLEEGHPNRAIMEVAKRKDVDVVVLGARGHSLVARALLGSTSDYVANHARCPVLVVRPSSARSSTADVLAAGKAPTEPMKVILAYDGSPGSKQAAAQMFALPWSSDTQIQITTLLERPPLIPDEEVYDDKAIKEGEKNLAVLVAEAKCKANVSYRVRETVHVGDTLAHLADEQQGDIIFVGDTGKSALAQFFLGSAARHILHHSSSSVWVARSKGWQ